MTSDERKMLNELLNDDSDRLSDWEMGFLEDVGKRTGDLTEKQADKLQAILDKVFG